jgi:vacuolar-type H+-ATPase subunit H
LDAKKHSEAILVEWELLSKERSKAILKEWEQKAKNILAEAHKEAKKIEEELINSRSTSLKSTSKLLVKKILQNDENLQDKYLDALINDLKK